MTEQPQTAQVRPITEMDRAALAAALRLGVSYVTVPADALRRLLDAERGLRARVDGAVEYGVLWLDGEITNTPDAAGARELAATYIAARAAWRVPAGPWVDLDTTPAEVRR